MTLILGLNFGHDGAVALIKNNKIVCAISNERLSRRKKEHGVTKEMIDYVLEVGQVSIEQIEQVAFSSYIYHPNNYIKIIQKNGQEFRQNVIDLFGGRTFERVMLRIGERVINGYFINHHIAHCASAYYTSPFMAAACMSVDASQRHPEACSLFAYGIDNRLYYLKCPGIMIGNAYSVFTEKLGLGPGLTKAGTTMGLASYGQVLDVAREKWLHFGTSFYERKFQQSDDVFINLFWSELSGLAPHQFFNKDKSDTEEAMNIAASLQFVFEKSLLLYADELFKLTKNYNQANLCLSGGSFLNSEVNMRIKKESSFCNLHLFPGCGDDGTAVGAALYLNHHILGNNKETYKSKELMYLGKEYSVPEVGEPYDEKMVALALSQGRLVAWYDGGSEFGPRALGHRSLLADPRSKMISDYINKDIKKREWFRPFAPIVLGDKASQWFDIDFESKFMLFIAGVKKPTEIAAVSHVDNTARLQTLAWEDNSKLYSLICAFEELTGVPVLLNTSMNVNGEPLVETPNDALNFFKSSGCDLLVMGDRMLATESLVLDRSELRAMPSSEHLSG